MFEKDFSYGAKFTGHMEIVVRLIENTKRRQKILDIPAGNGKLTTLLRECGHDAVSADINYAAGSIGRRPLEFTHSDF